MNNKPAISWFSSLAAYCTFVVMSSVFGGAIGGIIGFISFYEYFDMTYAAREGIIMGVGCGVLWGLVFGPLALRKSPIRFAVFVSAGTLVLSVWPALLGMPGVALILGISGALLGSYYALFGNSATHK